MTASSNDKTVVLETDVPLRRRETETEKHVKAAKAAGGKTPGSGVAQVLGVALGSIADDFVERLWGFLSVKDGLRSRLRSQTSKEREDHSRRATDLSLTYRFLTPLTHLVVEKPEVLADGTVADELPDDGEDGEPQGSILRETLIF